MTFDPDDDRWAKRAAEVAWSVVVLDRPDAAFAIGEFANPWHDELGRFAPKGTGTTWSADGRSATREVRLSDGRVGTIVLEHDRDVPTWDDRGLLDHVVVATAAAYSRNPLSVDTLRIRVSSGATVEEATGDIDTAAYVFELDGPLVTLNSEGDWYGNWSGAMPSAKGVHPATYTAVHEYGHLLDFDQRDMWDGFSGRKLGMRRRALHEAVSRVEGEPIRVRGMSAYGQTNTWESYAEAFTEWHLTGGRTRNRAARLFQKDALWA